MKKGEKMIADRAMMIDSSGIRKVFDLAQKLRNPIDLSIGQPDFDVPTRLKEEAKFWIDSGFNKYTVTQGIQELREKIRQKYSRQGIEIENLLITSGVSGGILLALMVLVDAGDEVIIPDPYFVLYKHLVNFIGGVPKFVNTYPDFHLRREEVEKQITQKTKIIFINTPSNPTGVSFTDNELKMIAQIAEKHNLVIIFDEIYENFNYDFGHINIAKYYPKTLILNGFSKSHGMTGWRLGYAAGPDEIIREMIKIQQYSFVCAPSFAQKVGVKALDYPMQEEIDKYRRKRDLIYDGLKAKFDVVKPNGAFYIFPRAPEGNADGFVEKAIRNNVLIIPGIVFSERNTHFRISFAASDETIQKGIEILNKLV